MAGGAPQKGFGPGKKKRGYEKAKDTKGTIKRLWKYVLMQTSMNCLTLKNHS